MFRCEIIANQSVQEELTNLFEEYIPEVLYTVVPVVTGKGKNSFKNGDTTWPETNFLLISYVSEESAEKVKKIVAALKEKFSSEGIKLFFVKAENV